jgi:periplasmic divalent cation tolerance protein
MGKPKPRAVASDGLVHVETTVDSESAARRIVGLVLAQRLAACAQIATVRSQYWWEGRIEDAAEFLVMFKTSQERRRELLDTIESEHPYELPYIAATSLKDVPAAYRRWLVGETSTKDR